MADEIEKLKACLGELTWSSAQSPRRVVEVAVVFDLVEDWNRVQPSINRPGIYAVFNSGKRLLSLAASKNVGFSWSNFVQYDDDCIRYKIMDPRFDEMRYLLAIMPDDASDNDLREIEQFLLARLEPLITDI